MTVRSRLRFEPTGASHRVTSLELFFDLVFVYALTQVTALMADDPVWPTVGRGVLILAILWFAWSAFSWLGNQAKADEGLLRAGLVVAMVAMFAVALSIPEAFDDRDGGLRGPLVFAVAIVAVRLVHLTVYLVAAGDDAALRDTLTRVGAPISLFAVLLVTGASVDGGTQVLLWALALAVDYIGIYVVGAGGWRLNAPTHFAERHGLIIIVALGESIVALGVGAEELAVTGPLVAAVSLGLVVSICLWWAYFDVVAPVAERVLVRAEGDERVRLGRDSYTYLHFPMVAGIVFLALGLKKVITYVGDSTEHELSDALTGVPVVALFGGAVLYLTAHVAFRLRNVGSVNVQRLAVAALLLALLPVAARVPALAALGMLAAVLCALIVFETIHYAEARHAVRHAEHD